MEMKRSRFAPPPVGFWRPLGAFLLLSAGLVATVPMAVASSDVPATLLGARWDGSHEVLVRMNPATGLVEDLATIPGVESVQQGMSAVDSVGRRFFMFGSGTQGDRLLTLNADTGDVLQNVAWPSGFTYPEFDTTSGKILGALWDGPQKEFVRIDPSTGEIENVAAITGAQGVQQGMSSFDATGRHFFMFGSGAGSGERLLTLDADTGGVLHDVAWPSGFTYPEFDSATGKLVGARWDGSQELFVHVDPSSGAVEDIATLPGVQSVQQGMSTFDAGHRRFYMAGSGPQIGDRFLTIDADAGNVLNSVEAAQNFVYPEVVAPPSEAASSAPSVDWSQVVKTTPSIMTKFLPWETGPTNAGPADYAALHKAGVQGVLIRAANGDGTGQYDSTVFEPVWADRAPAAKRNSLEPVAWTYWYGAGGPHQDDQGTGDIAAYLKRCAQYTAKRDSTMMQAGIPTSVWIVDAEARDMPGLGEALATLSTLTKKPVFVTTYGAPRTNGLTWDYATVDQAVAGWIPQFYTRGWTGMTIDKALGEWDGEGIARTRLFPALNEVEPSKVIQVVNDLKLKATFPGISFWWVGDQQPGTMEAYVNAWEPNPANAQVSPSDVSSSRGAAGQSGIALISTLLCLALLERRRRLS